MLTITVVCPFCEAVMPAASRAGADIARDHVLACLEKSTPGGIRRRR